MKLVSKIRGFAMIALTVVQIRAVYRSFLVLTGSAESYYGGKQQQPGKHTRWWRRRTTNRRTLDHVIVSRFMQHQPNLVHLGLARLELFRTVTLPSLRHQSNQEFLYIILTDPDLHPWLREPLLEAVKDIPNVVVVASNSKPHRVFKFPPQSVWKGSHSPALARHHAAAANNRTLLVTRLDADDGLQVDFVDKVQKQAAAYLHRDWMVWCITDHTEWHNHPALSNSTDNHPGLLIHRNMAPYCVTPGLTWGYAGAGTDTDVPSRNHAKLRKRLPRCEIWKNITSKCLAHLQNPNSLPLAIRSKTPTSAGMDKVAVNVSEANNLLNKTGGKLHQDALWEGLFPQFGIDVEQMRQTSKNLQDNLPVIVNDALRGQCTQGHSCKEEAREKLLALNRSAY